VFAVVVGALAYAAGLRTGAERARRQPSATKPADGIHGSGMGMPGPSRPSSAPKMDLAQMRASLAKVGDVEQLIGIANQHLDEARNREEQGHSEGTETFYTIAVAAYERALELRPKDPNLLTDLGIAYRGLGNPKQAVELFRQAAQADPKHLQSRYNLGLVLKEDLHDTASARAAWEEYLRVAPKADATRQQVESELAGMAGQK
jgi:cytochrome c-type biogenesis protein CcmH/NrfG